MFSKLDRVLINGCWNTTYLNTEVCFISEGYFYHCPVIISMFLGMVVGNKPFNFFPMWQSAPQYNDIISQTWYGPIQSTLMFQNVPRMKKVKGELKKLNKEGYEDIIVPDAHAFQVLQNLQKELHSNPSNLDLSDK